MRVLSWALALGVGGLVGACFDGKGTAGACCDADRDCGGNQRCDTGHCVAPGDDAPATPCAIPDPTAGSTGAGTGSGSDGGSGSGTAGSSTTPTGSDTGGAGSDTSTSGSDTGTSA